MKHFKQEPELILWFWPHRWFSFFVTEQQRGGTIIVLGECKTEAYRPIGDGQDIVCEFKEPFGSRITDNDCACG